MPPSPVTSDGGPEALGVQALARRPRSAQCSSSGVEQARRARRPRSRARRQSGTSSVEVGRCRACRRCRCAARRAGCACARPGRAARRAKMTSSAVGARVHARRRRRARRGRSRSMPITGVMPLPAVTKSTLAGRGRAARSRRVAWSSWTSVPGLALRTRWLLTLPSGIALTVIEMRPSGAVGRRGQRVGAPQAHAVDVDADPDVLARRCGRRQPRPGRITWSRRRAVSGCMATMRPRRSAPARSGLTRSR